MKIALLSSVPTPRAYGGMDRLLDGLLAALRAQTDAEPIAIGVDERSREGVLRGYREFYGLDLSGFDAAIGYKAPAYMARHPAHVGYLSHRLRVFYDRYEPAGEEHKRMRALVRWMDDWALDKSRLPYLYTVGETVCQRLRRYGGHESVALHHPSTLPPAPPRRGEHFLSAGRLHPWKRVDLVVAAFRRSRADCPLLVTGEGPDAGLLREMAEGDSRIQFMGLVDDAKLADLYAGAIATIFPPIEEDMGLVTWESMACGTPVLTASDAGEPALIVEPGKTGFVAAPTAVAMAERIDAMAADRSIAESMTEACLARAAKVTWGKVAETLLEACERSIDRRGAAARGGRSARAGRRPIELLVTDNQLLDPPVGGGRLRILELYRHLPEDFGTTYLGAFDHPGPAFRDRALAPNFREIVVPLTAGHFKLHHALARLSRGAATVDVTMPTLGRMSPRYRRELERLLPGADILIGAHPWMLPQFPRDVSTPIVYDAQNCEARVKAPMLEGSLTGRWLTGRVRAAERLAIERSRLILACSEEDRDAFIEEYGAAPEKIAVVPNGVDCAAIRPVDEARRSELKSERGLGDGPVALFAGSNYEPNLEAAEFIVDRLAPALPAVRFAIVGGVGVMLKERRRDWMPPENARLFGFVDFATLRELYGAADVALNPMSHGSGTNIKMFDYMAAALPILTTAVGARGLRGRGAEPWIEAPLDRWSEELAGLVANAETQRKLGEGARSLAEEKYDWSKISGELAERLRELVRR